MNQRIVLLLLLISQMSLLSAQSKKVKAFSIGFYNLENLFDTLDNPMINDEEFTPHGKRVWTAEKYNDKIANLATVISQLGRELTPNGLSILGVSEIENDTVLQSLIAHPLLSSKGYKYVHHNSSDRRGIDVAMIYREEDFEPISQKAFHVPNPNGASSRPTRDVLLVTGMLGDEKIHLTINHWPSRSGGEKRSAPFRNSAAQVNRQIIDSLLLDDQAAQIFVLGDLNDDPTSESLTKHLRAKKKVKSVGEDDMYNPMFQFYKKGIGSNAYRDRWSLFDQIVISASLLNEDTSHLKFHKAVIYNKNYLIQNFGRYKGYPFRTFDGDVFQNGYSDHLPVFCYVLKKVE